MQTCTDPSLGATPTSQTDRTDLELPVTDDHWTPPEPATAPRPTTIHSTREIEALIPHRWPFLLVDRIVEYDAEAQADRRDQGRDRDASGIFQGHFPGLPVMPGVLQVEALAQTMAVYVAKQPGFGDRIGLFAGIDELPLQAHRRARATRSASRSRWRSSAAASGAAGASPASTARSPARRPLSFIIPGEGVLR